nr:hypothetical protein BaRGS_021497 [Batillaria attramentaria]
MSSPVDRGTPRSDLWEGVVEVTDGNFAKEVLGHDKMVFKGGQINDEEPEDYGGLPTSSAIVRWSLKTLAAESSDSKTDVVELSDSKFDREVTNNIILKENCENHHQLCFVSVLPHIYDCQSACRIQYLHVLKRLAETYKRQPWGPVEPWDGEDAELPVEEEDIDDFGTE